MFINGHEYKGQAPGSFIGLDLTENMYLGAVPDFRRISRLAGYTKGFVGRQNIKTFKSLIVFYIDFDGIGD